MLLQSAGHIIGTVNTVTNCPHCNEPITIIRAGRRTTDGGRREKVYQMSAWLGAGADTLERTDAPTASAPSFKQEPARAPTVQSDVVVPALRSVITGIGVGAGLWGGALIAGVTTPGAFAGIGFTIAATGWWLRDVGELKSLMWRVEERFDRDFDGDNQVGQPAPPVDNIVPVYAGPNVSAVDVPEPPPVEEGNRLIRLRPSERTIRKRVLWSYLLAAFMSNDWTRAGCKAKNINTKQWADVRNFVKRWPGVWETDQRPTIDAFLRNLGYTGPNRAVLDELNRK